MSIDRQKVAEVAQKYTAKNQFDKAIAEYQRILAEDPNDVRVLLKVGDLQVRMNARTQAIETYSKVAGTYDQQGLHLKAVAVYKQILQIDPGLLHLYNKLADLYVKLGLAPDAMQHLDALAQRYARAEDHASLAAVYRRMLQIDSSSIPTRIRFAELLSKLGRGDEAAAEFEAGCALLDTAGRVDEWARVAERLYFHRPTDVRVARKLAAYYLERSDAKRALPKLQICYKSNARDVVTLDLLASAFRALNQLPKTISVLKEIARIHNGEGKLKERNEVYQRVLELAPTDAEAREALRAGSHATRRPQSGSHPAAAAQPPAAPAPAAQPAALSSKDPPRLSLEPPRVSQPSGPVLETVDEPPESDVVTVEDGEEVIFESSQMPPRGESRASLQAPAPTATGSQAEGPSGRATSSVTPSFATTEEFGATQRDSMRPGGALATPFVHRGATTPPPSATSSSPPRAGGNVTEAARLLGEAEIFLKYGLKAKASAHLAKASELEADSIDLHVRIRDLYVSMGDQGGVARECVVLAALFESSDPTAALIEARRAVEADPNNVLAHAMVERLQGAEEYSERAEESFIDEGAVVMSDPSGTAEEPGASAAEGHSAGEHPAYDQPYPNDGYDYAGDATEIGESPVGTQSQEFYGYEAGIRVEVEDEDAYAQPPRSSYPGARREIEEGLDEAEFFITQGLYDDARDTLYQLLEMHPNHPLVLERIEEVEQLMQVQTQSAEQDPSYGLAEKLAEEVDGLNPMDGGPPTGQIDVETVLAQFKQGIGRTVSIEDCDTHYDLGIAYKEMGLLDDAIAEFQIATLNPGRQCIGETMIGLCFLEKGDITSAVEHFKAGLQAPQRNEREELGLYFEMGAAYEYLGDLSEALYFFQKVDKRDPAFRNVRDRVQRLYAAVHSDPSRRPPGVEDVDRAFDELLKE